MKWFFSSLLCCCSLHSLHTAQWVSFFITPEVAHEAESFDMGISYHTKLCTEFFIFWTADVAFYRQTMGFPGGSDSKESACNAGDRVSIPGSGRSPGEGNGNLLQYSCLGNPMNRGASRATVHGVAKSRAWLSDWHTHTCHWSTKIHGFCFITFFS